jgi:hypothetical protein
MHWSGFASQGAIGACPFLPPKKLNERYLFAQKPVGRRGGHEMQFAEWTYPLRKFDDIYYTIERIVYGKGELKGFSTDDIYNNLRDRRFFQDAQDLNRYLLDNGAKYKIKKTDEFWERYY